MMKNTALLVVVMLCGMALIALLARTGNGDTWTPPEGIYRPVMPISGEKVTAADLALKARFRTVSIESSVLGNRDLKRVTQFADTVRIQGFSLYYADFPVGDRMNCWDFFDRGGIQIIQANHGHAPGGAEAHMERIRDGQSRNSHIESISGHDVVVCEGSIKHEAYFYDGDVIYHVVTGPQLDMAIAREIVSIMAKQVG